MEQLQRKWLRNWIKYYDELSINRRQNMNSYYQFVLKIFSWTLPAVVFLLANLFYITNLEAKDIEISDAWARASIIKDRPTSAYFTITNNNSHEDFLLSANSSSAKKIEIHKSKVENGIARMMRVDTVRIPPHKKTKLRPGGYHLMLFELVKPAKAGEHMRINLVFKVTGEKSVMVPVKKSANMSHHNHNKMHHHTK